MYWYGAHRVKIASKFGALNSMNRDSSFADCTEFTKCNSRQINLLYLPRATEQKQKYRGMFETQKSRNKTSSGDIGLNIRTLASPKVGQDQVSGGVSVLCWHAAPVANVLWKPLAIR